MASQKQLAGTRITRKGHSNTQNPEPTPTMVAGGEQCAPRSTITPNKTCSANLYRCMKRRVGRSLKRTHCKRVLVPTREQAAYKLSGTKSSLSSLKRVPGSLLKQDSTCSNQQHYSSVINKQGSSYEVGPTMCPTVENLDLVNQETSDPQSPTHSMLFECGSRQAIQTRPDHSDRMVPPSRDFSNYMHYMPQIDLFATRFNNKLPLLVSPVPDSLTTAVDALSQPGEDLDAYAFLPVALLGKVVEKLLGLPMQKNNPDCPEVAKHALVLGPSVHVQPDPTEPAQSAQSVGTALQSDPSQKSDKSKSPCMAPTARATEEQGFAEAVAARIEAPQRGSTKSVYVAKWTIFTKWCLSNQVDFRVPPLKAITKLQTGTIDCIRLKPMMSRPLLLLRPSSRGPLTTNFVSLQPKIA